MKNRVLYQLLLFYVFQSKHLQSTQKEGMTDKQGNTEYQIHATQFGLLMKQWKKQSISEA